MVAPGSSSDDDDDDAEANDGAGKINSLLEAAGIEEANRKGNRMAQELSISWQPENIGYASLRKENRDMEEETANGKNKVRKLVLCVVR